MPTYSYACTLCGHEFDVVQSISDGGLTTCPACQGALRKVFHPVGVAFKGSGFYRTDSRAAAKAEGSGKASDGGGSSTDSGSKGSSESTTTDSGGAKPDQPAATKPASTGKTASPSKGAGGSSD